MNLSKNDLEIARIVGNGVVVQGIREALEVYHRLWALGYRPGVPLTFWMRQRKRTPKGPKRSTAPAEYNPKQEGEEGVDQG